MDFSLNILDLTDFLRNFLKYFFWVGSKGLFTYDSHNFLDKPSQKMFVLKK